VITKRKRVYGHVLIIWKYFYQNNGILATSTKIRLISVKQACHLLTDFYGFGMYKHKMDFI
jgi:hypothetical protein